MRNPYLPIIDIIVLAAFIFAFFVAEAKDRLILVTIAVLLFIFPLLFQIPAHDWVCLIGRVIFGIGCYLYIRWHGFFR